MTKQKNKVLDKIAVGNGYKDKFELLRDYNIIPTVKMPKHKKMEFDYYEGLWKHSLFSFAKRQGGEYSK